MIGGVDARSDIVEAARSFLSDACANLDDAVRSLSASDTEETVMANPALVALLLRVVAARRHLESLELLPAAGPASSLR